jgi:glycosyltransferase involved in cell wall biosynthesis
MSGRFLFDVTGLLHWYAFRRHPSGIQRVAEKLVATASMRKNPRVEFVARMIGHDGFYRLDGEVLAGLSTPGDRSRSIARLRSLFTVGTRCSSLSSFVGAIGPGYIPYVCLGRLHLERGVEAMLMGHRSPAVSAPAPAPPPGPDDVFFHPGDLFWQARCVQVLLDLKRATGVRLVQMVHDLFIDERPDWFEPKFQRRFGGELRRLGPHVDRWVTNSAFVKSGLAHYLGAHGLPARPIGVLPMGWDSFALDGGEAGLEGDRAALRRLGLADRPFMLFVGTVEPRKNLATLLDAVEALRRELGAHRPDIVVPDLAVVGGGGWKSAEVKARLRRMPGVHWFRAATDADLAVLYRHARFTVAPSFSEGWGLPVQESLAHGVPCIASCGGAMPEAAHGLAELFDPSDGMALKAAMARWIVDDGALAAARDRITCSLSRTPLPTWDDAAAFLLNEPSTQGS